MAKILGKQNVDYTSKKTGQPVQGITLHLATTNNKVEGFAVETCFISMKSELYSVVAPLPINSEVRLTYNRWGNVDDVILIDKK